MHRRTVLSLIGASLAATVALSSAAHACGPEREFQRPLRLSPSTGEAKIRHTIKGEMTQEYVLHGKPGQKVEIALEAKKTTFSLSPDLAPAGKPRWGNALKDARSVRTWSGTLPKSGRMLIDLQTDANRDSYALMVKRA